ncbi:MAG: hypothetical protein ACREUA_02540, partial [Burkholderiales bacterium]
VTSFAYDTSYGGQKRLRLVSTNAGYALGFTYRTDGYNDTLLTSVCAFNLAAATASTSTPCPTGARSAQYSHDSQTVYPGPRVIGYVAPDGGGATYTYEANNCFVLNSIQGAGSTAPDVVITFNSQCRVSNQSFGGGAVSIGYTYWNTGSWDVMPFNNWTIETKGGGTVKHTFSGGALGSATVEDQIERVTAVSLEAPCIGGPSPKADPEGNVIGATCNARRDATETRITAKPGSGLANIATTADFPTDCTNPVTCDKPTSASDAKGNTTSYTYDPVHGGMLTTTAPAVDNIAPVVRRAYVQRYAWLSNGAGGYQKATAPLWLIANERTCRTTATTGNPTSGYSCAGGSADEVVTYYDYGLDSGPNNLLLRGIVVAADGNAYRVCYGYDVYGNRVSETQPNANLGFCP